MTRLCLADVCFESDPLLVKFKLQSVVSELLQLLQFMGELLALSFRLVLNLLRGLLYFLQLPVLGLLRRFRVCHLVQEVQSHFEDLPPPVCLREDDVHQAEF